VRPSPRSPFCHTHGTGYGIYIASKAKHGPRWLAMRAAGVPFISTWIDECGVGATSDWADLWFRCIHEASMAHAVILYVEEGETLKGALVEAGAALAHGVHVHVVSAAPLDHTFVRHPHVHEHSTLEEALGAIGKFGIDALVDDVRAFSVACGNVVNEEPRVPHRERIDFRNGLLREEWREALTGLDRRDPVKVADGLADIIYVSLGTALEWGITPRLPGGFKSGSRPGMRGLLAGAVEYSLEKDGARDDSWDWARLGEAVNLAILAAEAGNYCLFEEKLNQVIEWAIIIAALYGFPFDKVWDEVHRSNMDKIDPATGKVLRTPAGKVGKPEGWRPPDIEGVLARTGWLATWGWRRAA